MSFKIAAWSEAADRALLAAVVACDYRWRDVAVRLEREGHQGCTMQACERRFRLLVERERAHRAEHLARLTREPVVETAHSNLIFRERDGSLKPVAREHMEGPKRTYRPPARNKLLNRPVRERASPRRSASLSAAALRINWRFHSLCCALSIIASGERTWATTWPRPSGPSMCSLMQPSGHIPAPESAWAGFLSGRLREHMNHSMTMP